jgi:hypothetical protein
LIVNNNAMRIIICLLLFFFSLLVISCTLLGPDIVLILQMPSLPLSWPAAFPDLSYLVCYPDETGNLAYYYAPDDQLVMQISLNKKYNSFVVVYPLVGNGEICLRPAGAVFPLHLKSGSENTLLLSWEAGFTAHIFEQLWKKHVDLSYFNTVRFISEAREKSPEDPWQLDENLILEHLAAYDFSVYDIKKLPARDIALSAFPGTWFSESPFSNIYPVGEDGQLNLPGLSFGFHRLFQLEAGKRLDLYLTENECIIIGP